ncbi:GTP cyclohydrolase II [Streptomyces lomondensis]|uniref:GTP cyclohydrolase II domain-containing protein n=1 Tax=Streptomyces lomondensis TaxID=68229 RepID=A0ABQ2XEM8_9ACTN|nr:GTP cyclohydrolase II [Streptomyces lomondensis]MCF0077630.1 GTP cyclohydrolase II [Streptomyces lomondensis]GGX13774.1 hypothetical protein GCM10010383_49780 [Streptomyces lomondensis]
MIIATTLLETAHGTFSVSTHEDGTGQRCLSMSHGDLSDAGTAVRLHSSCIFGEALMATDCDCGPQLHTTMQEITKRGAGAIVYLFQEGRGAGLDLKIRGMETQRVRGVNSYEAYASLGLGRDMRDYSVAGTALADLGMAEQVTLISNNPLKRQALEELGYQVESQIALSYEVSKHAYEYLLMKQVEGDHTVDFGKIKFVG